MLGARRAAVIGLASRSATDDWAVDPNRFSGPLGSGEWTRPPAPWNVVDVGDTAAAARPCITAAVAGLATDQRVVVVLHDIHRLGHPAICDLLSITEADVLRLLHLGRSALRQVLETRFGAA